MTNVEYKNDMRRICYLFCKLELSVVSIKSTCWMRLTIKGRFVDNGVVGVQEIIVYVC